MTVTHSKSDMRRNLIGDAVILSHKVTRMFVCLPVIIKKRLKKEVTSTGPITRIVSTYQILS